MHWYSLNSKTKFSRRHDLKLILPDSKWEVSGKTESRPHLVDWDRDGFDDLVVAMKGYEVVGEAKTERGFLEQKYRQSTRVFINTDSSSRAKQIRNGSKEKAEKSSTGDVDEANLGAPSTAADLKVKLQETNLNFDGYDRGFVFTDVDRDGNFDVVCYVNSWNRGADDDGHWVNEYLGSKLTWRRNLTSKGLPKFAEPDVLFETQKPIQSIAVVDFDGDGQMEVAFNSDGAIRLLTRCKSLNVKDKD